MDQVVSSDGQDESTPAPIRPSQRLESLDVLRGVAVLGILSMNIIAFGLPGVAYFNPAAAGGLHGANLVAWLVGVLLLEGTMRALFSMMFGAGIILLTSRLERGEDTAGAYDIYLRRNMWLIVLGVIHSYLLLWTGDILYTYGICGMLLIVCRRLKPRTLVIGGLLILAFLVPKRILHHRDLDQLRDSGLAAEAMIAEGMSLGPELEAKLERWQEQRPKLSPTAEDAEVEIERHQGTYLEMVSHAAKRARSVHTKSFYDFWLWDALGVMLLGMALLKLGILTGERSTRFYLWWTLIFYAVGLLVNGLEARAILASDFDPIIFLRADLTYDLGRVCIAAGHLGLVMLFCRLRVLPVLRHALSAAGRMALTNYMTQTVLSMLLFMGFGLGLFGRLQRWQLYVVVVAIWVVELIWSVVWLRFFRSGPLEWLWRSLSYWRLQPLRLRSTLSAGHISAGKLHRR